MFLTAFLLAALFLGGGTPADAAPQSTFTVNTTTDAPDAQPGNGICETAIGNGICTLRASIMEANGHPGADIIQLPAGAYKLTRVGEDYTALNGDLDITESLGIYGVGALSTIIDGNGVVTQDRVMETSNGSALSIFDLSIRGGVSQDLGGGIFNQNQSTLTLTNTNVSFNSTNGDGGGVASFGPLRVTNSVVSANLAKNGGGIYASKELKLTGSTISGNRATEDGGGIASPAVPWLNNSTISGNRADGRGGGIYSGNVFLNNVTIVSNVADDDNNDAADGGGIYTFKDGIDMRNTIIANNYHRSTLTPLPLPDDCKAKGIGGSYNLIETLTGCPVNNAHQITGQDPQLGPLQNNGGTTQTHALNASSPAIDAGDPSGCKEQISDVLLMTDQRGAPRHVDGDNNRSPICDMGAFEYGGGATNPTSTPTKTSTNPPPTVTKTVTATVTRTATKPPPTATRTATKLAPATATPTNTRTATPTGGCTTKPGKPSLLAPPNNKALNKVKVKLDWTDVPCATKYKVRVMQDGKDGPFVDQKTVTVSQHKTGDMLQGHTYFWLVKACNSHGCAKSETRTFTVKP
jgi:CSLREA domain-containing protein